MANIYLQTCSATEAGQQWVAMTDGRIALAASSPRKCLSLPLFCPADLAFAFHHDQPALDSLTNDYHLQRQRNASTCSTCERRPTTPWAYTNAPDLGTQVRQTRASIGHWSTLQHNFCLEGASPTETIWMDDM